MGRLTNLTGPSPYSSCFSSASFRSRQSGITRVSKACHSCPLSMIGMQAVGKFVRHDVIDQARRGTDQVAVQDEVAGRREAAPAPCQAPDDQGGPPDAEAPPLSGGPLLYTRNTN